MICRVGEVFVLYVANYKLDSCSDETRNEREAERERERERDRREMGREAVSPLIGSNFTLVQS